MESVPFIILSVGAYFVAFVLVRFALPARTRRLVTDLALAATLLLPFTQLLVALPVPSASAASSPPLTSPTSATPYTTVPTAGTRISLPFVSNGGAPPPTTTPTSTPSAPSPTTTPTPGSSSSPTSEGLIDAAYKSGQITLPTALLYKTYAAFGDPRLPSQYQGDDSQILDSDVLRDVVDNWASLDPTTQQLLDPFFVPPMYVGSWGDPSLQRQTTGSVRTSATSTTPLVCTPSYTPGDYYPPPQVRSGWAKIATNHSNVWYEVYGDSSGLHLYTGAQSQLTAQYLADNVEHVYDTETALFGRAPITDVGMPCSGSDGKLDIYVFRDKMSRAAETVAFPPGCMQRPVYMWIAPDYAITDQIARDVLAHEFFHAIDFSYSHAKSCGEYIWLAEATAQQMIDVTYPTDQYEQKKADGYMQYEHLVPLEEGWSNGSSPNTFGTNGYSDYVFLLELTRRYGASTLTSIWNNTQTTDSLGAIDQATSAQGGLAKVWPQFSVDNWNDWGDAVQDAYYQWDGLQSGLKRMFANGDSGQLIGFDEYKTKHVTLDGAQGKVWPLLQDQYGNAVSLEHLSTWYEHLDFTDDNARSIAIYNPFVFSNDPAVSFQALVKIHGHDWQLQDWSALQGKRFCRDSTAERVDELVLIYANSSTDRSHIPQPTQDGKLVANNIGCWGWQGTATGTYTTKGFWSYTMAATVTLQQDRTGGFFSPSEIFRPTSGSAIWTMTDLGSDCQVYSGGPTTVPIQSGDGYLSVYNYLDGGTGNRSYSGSGSSSNTFSYTVSCNGSTQTNPWLGASWFFVNGTTFTVSADGQTIEGTATTADDSQHSQTYEWHLTAVRQ